MQIMSYQTEKPQKTRPTFSPAKISDDVRIEEERQKEFREKAKLQTADLTARLGRKPTCHVSTFGCQMNARDSEKLLGVLLEAGFEEIDSEDADFVIFNTCTVRDNADQRVFGRLGRISHFKKNNRDMKVAICGCMMQEQGNVDKVRKSYPFVDLIFGTHNLYRFPEYLSECLTSDHRVIDIWDGTQNIVEDLPVERKYSYKSGINIMFGCNNFCSYCIVPYVRGRERSREPMEIIREIEGLVADGVVEIMLLGQNVNSYGKDLEDKVTFAQLLDSIAQIKGLRRIRFMTPHPKDLSEDVVDVITRHENIARHIHFPLQSGSNQILKRMNRHYTKELYIDRAKMIREKIPDVAITTDIIVGFPGETAADVDDTIDVVNRVGFDNAYTFIYSKRRGTPAAKMPDQVPEDLVKEGFDRVLKTVQQNARKRAQELEGRIMEGLVEEVNGQKEGYMTARLSNNMLVHIPGNESMIGKFYPIKLEECHGFYYFGSISGERI